MCEVEKAIPELVSYEKWLSALGRSNVTGWRRRQRGWITTINIAGRHYVQREEIDRFNARAARGDFSKPTTIPRKAFAE